MSQRASVVIDFKAAGVNDVKRAMAGIISETRKAAVESRRAIEAEKAALRSKTAAERKASRDAVMADRAAKKQQEALGRASTKTAAEQAKARLMAQRTSLKAETDAVRAAERMKRDESKRTSQEARRLAQADAREFTRQARAWQRHSAQQERTRVHRERETERRRQAGRESTDEAMGIVASGALGIGTALAGAGMAYGAENYNRSRQWIGMEDEDALVSRYGATHDKMRIAANAGGRPVSELESLALRASSEYGVAPDISGDLFANIQDSFTDQMGSVIEHWETINQMSAAYGADLRGVARSGAIVQRDLGVSQSDFDDALAVMAGSTTSGGVNVGELSTQFGTTPNLLRQAFGDDVTGLQGAQTFSTFAQISGRSGLEGSERATATDRFLQELNDPETWKRLRESTGGRVSITEGVGASEHLRDPRAVMEALMSPELSRAGVIGDVFQSLPARQFLAGHRTAGMSYYDRLMSESTPEAGRALMAQQMTAAASDPSFLARQAVGRQAASVYRQAPALIERGINQTGYISEWNSNNVGTTEMVRTPMSIAASGAEGIMGFLDTLTGDGGEGAWLRTQREAAPEWMRGAAFDSMMDPRIAMRGMMGGNVGALTGWQGQNAGPMLGNDTAGASMSALVSDIIRQATAVGGGTGVAGGQGNVRGEVTDPIVRALGNVEGAIGRISLPTPQAGNGGTADPTPPRPRPR